MWAVPSTYHVPLLVTGHLFIFFPTRCAWSLPMRSAPSGAVIRHLARCHIPITTYGACFACWWVFLFVRMMQVWTRSYHFRGVLPQDILFFRIADCRNSFWRIRQAIFLRPLSGRVPLTRGGVEASGFETIEREETIGQL